MTHETTMGARRAAGAHSLPPQVSPQHHATNAEVEAVAELAEAVRANMERVIEGKRTVVDTAVTVLLAGGHLLLEDVPGVGKTQLSKALARSIDGTVRRIQFTPDLLPSDITGVSVFDTETRRFEFHPGGVFANVVIGDEINRASPKTQSALLECMEERQVTVDNSTYALEAPFIVIATQNPAEMEGTYSLPEAQRDRFMARVSMGYPTAAAEVAMLNHHAHHNPLDALAPVAHATHVLAALDIVGRVHLAPAVQEYVVALASATRTHPDLRLGASPRASLHLARAAKARAALEGRAFVLPGDVQAVARDVLAHRLEPSLEASMAGRTPEQALEGLLRTVPVGDDRS